MCAVAAAGEERRSRLRLAARLTRSQSGPEPPGALTSCLLSACSADTAGRLTSWVEFRAGRAAAGSGRRGSAHTAETLPYRYPEHIGNAYTGRGNMHEVSLKLVLMNMAQRRTCATQGQIWRREF